MPLACISCAASASPCIAARYSDVAKLMRRTPASASSRTLKDLLSRLTSRGLTVFLTSHVLDVVEKLCTHVGIIAKGRLVEQASLEDIRRGGSLEQRFLEKVGVDEAATRKLSWLDEDRV